MQVYGDALSMPVPDVDRTDHLLILGANPAASNGSMMGLGDVRARMQAIRARGGRVVLIDPRRTETAAWCDAATTSSGRAATPALLLALLHVLFAEGRAGVGVAADGLPALRELAARFSPERVAPAIDIGARRHPRARARLRGGAPRRASTGASASARTSSGRVATWLVEALNIVTGHFDREGGVMFPTPAADIAPLGRLLIGNHYGRWRSRVRGLPEFLGALPSAVMAEEMETPGPGQIRALVCFAGNPVSLDAQRHAARARARRARLRGRGRLLRQRDHAPRAHRPAAGARLRDRQLRPRAVAPRGAQRRALQPAHPRARAGHARRLGDPVRAGDAPRRAAARPRAARWRRLARDLPERVVDLFLRAGKSGLTLAKLRGAPHGIDLGPLTPRGGRLRTRSGRPCLAPPILVADIPRLERWIDAPRTAGLVLIGRRHVRSNNSWLHNLPSLVKGADRTRLLVHPADAARLGLGDGDAVRVASRTGNVRAIVGLSADVMPGVCSLPHGFGQAAAAATLRVAGKLTAPSANALTDEELVEPVLGTSILNGVPVTLVRDGA